MFHEPIIYENIEDNPAVIQMTQEEYDIWVKENGLIDATPFLNNFRKI